MSTVLAHTGEKFLQEKKKKKKKKLKKKLPKNESKEK